MTSSLLDKIQQMHTFDEAVGSNAFRSVKGALPFAVGFDQSDSFVCCSLAKMPHMFVCGSTGSGKSVLLHSVVNSLLAENTDDVRLALVDPKMVEFACYANNPNLACPVVTDCESFVLLLENLLKETENRYRLFVQEKVRDITCYNEKVLDGRLPYIVVVVDEFAEMLVGDSRKKIVNLLLYSVQKCRAAGIHFVLATAMYNGKFPSTLLANFYARAIFKLPSEKDSQKWLGFGCAERLSCGEMIFLNPSVAAPLHLKAFLPTAK